MNVKNQNFNVTIPDDSVIDYGDQQASSPTPLEIDTGLLASDYTFIWSDATGAVVSTTNYSVPGGSIIKLKFRAQRSSTGFPGGAKEYTWDMGTTICCQQRLC